MNLSDLWNLARCYGRVTLSTSENGKYWSVIKFNTIKHVELEARHAGYFDKPEEALYASIKIAEQVVETTSSQWADIQIKKKLLGHNNG